MGVMELVPKSEEEADRKSIEKAKGMPPTKLIIVGVIVALIVVVAIIVGVVLGGGDSENNGEVIGKVVTFDKISEPSNTVKFIPKNKNGGRISFQDFLDLLQGNNNFRMDFITVLNVLLSMPIMSTTKILNLFLKKTHLLMDAFQIDMPLMNISHQIVSQ